MKRLAGIVVIVLLARAATACFWVTGTTYETKAVTVSGFGAASRLRWYLKTDHQKDGLRMEADLRNSTNYNDRSDYAISLAYLGRNQEAVDILQRLEQEQPGKYFVAANLGTALELAGNNDEALRWIREGIRRNPNSHHGTEWLHAKILEAKIAQQKDPDYFKNHTVLDLDPKNVHAEVTVDGKRFSPKEVAQAIQGQLQERLQFVKPPDQPVASLLFDYAAVEAATHTLESAKGLLKMAVEYGYPVARVESQMKLYDKKIAWRKIKQYLWYCFLAAFGIGALIVLYKRKFVGAVLQRPANPENLKDQSGHEMR